MSDPKLRRFLIHEVGIDGRGLRQLTGTSDDRMAGADGRQTALIEDLGPCYLPDGGFAFVSTRLQTHVRCQYGGRYFANFVLYRADGDGSNIRRISFGEASEREPSVLHDGRIVYTRWDYINRHDTFFQSLWGTRPDGTAAAHLYGNYTRNPCTTGEPKAVPGSQKIVSTATAHHGYTAGSVILVDPHRGQEGETPITDFANYSDVDSWPALEVKVGNLDGTRKVLEAYVKHMESLIPTFPAGRGTDTLMTTYERVVRLARNRNLDRPAELLEVLAVFNPKKKTTQKCWPGGPKQGKQESLRWVDFADNTAQPLVRRWFEKRYASVVRVLLEAVKVYDRLRADSGRLNYQDLLLGASRLLCDKPQIRVSAHRGQG